MTSLFLSELFWLDLTIRIVQRFDMCMCCDIHFSSHKPNRMNHTAVSTTQTQTDIVWAVAAAVVGRL